MTTPVNEDLSDKERLAQLETRVDELVNLLRSVYKQQEVDENEYMWFSDFNGIREKLNNVYEGLNLIKAGCTTFLISSFK